MLRDRLVCGVRNARIQKKLLAETGLTFKKAFETAKAVETAEHQARELQANGRGSERPVHHVQDKPVTKPGQPRNPAEHTAKCYPCGGKHNSSECRFKEATCRSCGKDGREPAAQETRNRERASRRKLLRLTG